MGKTKFRIAVYERLSPEMPWEFVEYITNNQRWALNICGDITSDESYYSHYTRHNAPDSVHRVYEPEFATNLNDAHGGLIYANDLIKSPNNSHALVVKQAENGLWECWEHRPDGMRELPLFDLIRNYGVEIIGNIHDKEQNNDR